MGITLPFKQTSLRGRLEYARHYGVPSPLIDFSHSPYVALFFAFSGVRPLEAKDDEYSTIFCLNIFGLADIWARIRLGGGLVGIDPSKAAITYADVHNDFKYDAGRDWATYPIGVLDYIELPASWNRRMLRQLGVFLYDTLNYQSLNCKDLEELLEREKEVQGPDTKPALTKVLIPHKVGRKILERLEILGMTATVLLESHEGAAIDVINSYNYSRKTGRGWDI